MREILFRGKRVDNGEWVEGSFVDLGCVIVAPTIDGKNVSIYGSRPTSFQVIRGTIGQFTGLLDKNGTKIFEGDICKIWFDVDKIEDYIYQGLSQEELNSGTLTFTVESPLFNNQAELNADVIEVIGNIHDKEE